jgi:hypothetical protein
MSEEFDATYVPSGALLAHVGLTAKKTDDAWYNVIKTNAKKTLEMEVQNAVAALTLFMRGNTHETIAAEVGVDVRTVKRWCVQGQAILRTVNAGEDAKSRAMSATRLGGGVSMGLVDAATKTDGDDQDKLETLETMALSSTIKQSFVKEDQSALSDDEVAEIVTSLPEQAQANLGTDKAPTAKQMMDAVPNVAESFGIQRKVTTRTPQTDGGTGPQGLEFHMKAALKDIRAIANAADEAYVPTPEDMAALFKVCQYLNLELMLDEATEAAIKNLAEVAW